MIGEKIVSIPDIQRPLTPLEEVQFAVKESKIVFDLVFRTNQVMRDFLVKGREHIQWAQFMGFLVLNYEIRPIARVTVPIGDVEKTRDALCALFPTFMKKLDR